MGWIVVKGERKRGRGKQYKREGKKESNQDQDGDSFRELNVSPEAGREERGEEEREGEEAFEMGVRTSGEVEGVGSALDKGEEGREREGGREDKEDDEEEDEEENSSMHEVDPRRRT